MGERENRETATARSLSVVHYIERDQDAAARLVAGLLERSVGRRESNLCGGAPDSRRRALVL
jgi:hypothetical protein